ncbi:transposase [Thermoleptolyngbya sp. C42_A2020_037]|uniref:IS110 family transposase n=1 Tax=Thermoleptolyngbya sp. C42_A2020_037 TaxID=2747799 RepID=UPI001A07FC42|nr:transposase [Thermoleptolyngbya sp. C42_A2020_037]MBF2086132.1 transposase [Thermoleptolyngbya sp. C42_A2020_037]
MKNTTPVQSYDGEQIYVGIDVHKKTYVVVARVNQVIVKKWSTTAKPADLAAQLLKYFPGGNIHTVYEAGFSGFVLHRELNRRGIDNRVVHPAAVEVAVHNRVKTDKRDAEKLSTQLEAERLRGLRVPTPAQEERRMLSRTRSQLVQERTTIKHQIRMKAQQLGLNSSRVSQRRTVSNGL